MKVTRDAVAKYIAIDSCASEDIFDLIAAAQEDPQTFFDCGLWESLDFSACDMSHVRFRDATVIGCFFRVGDLSEETIASCRVFSQNQFVPNGIGPISMFREETRTIEVEDLLALIHSYNPHCNADLIREAYSYGMQKHEGQLRHSGEPYFTHPVAVAAILAEVRLDDATIITALLHDIMDTNSVKSEIVEKFGEDIAELVDGVTRLNNLQFPSTESHQPENFGKLFLAISKDWRVVLVKLVDRLHNMRTLKSIMREKRILKARETLAIYAPLAGHLGIQWICEELEDLAFHVLIPDAREAIIRRFIRLQRETREEIPMMAEDIRAELNRVGIEADVSGRAKKPYSIWCKMQERDLAFSRLSDIYDFCVITTNEADCIRALQVIHQHWTAVTGHFSDNISAVKSNGSRLIQTTVSGRDVRRMCIQISSRQIQPSNESGVAANWSHREGGLTKNLFSVDRTRMAESQPERFYDECSDRFNKNAKLEMYQDQVFCFTPKGDVIQLPRGATPLDYAYAIHTRIGNSCVSAKIDGIRVPLWTKLKNGQSVDIIGADGQIPQASWTDIVITARAKAAIRKSLRGEDRRRFIRVGQELARIAFSYVGKKVTEMALNAAAMKLRLADKNEVLAQLGTGNISGYELITAIYPELTAQELAGIKQGWATIRDKRSS